MEKDTIFYWVWWYIMRDTTGEVFITRKGLIKYLENKGYANNSKDIDFEKEYKGVFSESTVDNYRRMLTACGYLESDGKGKYYKIKPIPETMTTSKLNLKYRFKLEYGYCK